MDQVASYYKADPSAVSVDPDLLIEKLKLVTRNAKHLDLFSGVIRKAAGEGVSVANLESVLLGAKLAEVSTRLGTSLINANHGPATQALVEKYVALAGSQEVLDEPLDSDEDVEIISGIDLAAIRKDSLDVGSRIKLLPRSLNEAVGGGVFPGTHIVLFARPEMGKTAQVFTFIKGFVKNQGLPGIYFFNEDPVRSMKLRLLCSLVGKTESELNEMKDEEILELINKANAELVTMVSLSPGTLGQIESLVKRFEPRWIIVDQIRNLAIGDDNRVTQLEKAATGMRNIIKRYDLVGISVTQAGDSASGKAILEMGDCDFSNTGIPAQCDIMLGLGATRDMESLGERCLSLPKNKLNGNHSAIMARINTLTSTVYSV